MPGGSQGNFCLGGDIGRFNANVLNTGADGNFELAIGTSSMPTNPPRPILAGETWNFQAWFRDRGLFDTSAFTDAVSITFQ